MVPNARKQMNLVSIAREIQPRSARNISDSKRSNYLLELIPNTLRLGDTVVVYGLNAQIEDCMNSFWQYRETFELSVSVMMLKSLLILRVAWKL
jgi:hypothetical protein